VQTLKSGEGLVREEHEVLLPGSSIDWPGPERERHHGTQAGTRLEKVLVKAAEPVTERFRTDFSRLSAPFRTRRGWVELSLDRGTIQAGDRSVSLCELEIELIRGSPRAVTEVAAMMIRRYGLWIDLRSKAQRGHLLAAGLVQAPVRRADPCVLRREMALDEAWRTVAQHCVTPILAQASQIAADEGHLTEHIHQIRVGLRRLRTALRMFHQAVPDAGLRSERAGKLARELGATRDRDVMAEALWPALARVQAPLVALPQAAVQLDPKTIIRSVEHQIELLRLIEHSDIYTGNEVAPPEPTSQTLCEELALSLESGWRSVRRKARRFDELSEEDRHRLRRQLKRLRYGLDFSSSLLPAGKLRKMTRALAQAQEALGEYNDTVVALAAYRAHAERDARAWFAAGWLASQIPVRLERCRETLDALCACKCPWTRPARRAPITPRVTDPLIDPSDP